MSIVGKIALSIPLIAKLGILNVLNVCFYRIAKKIGFWKRVSKVSGLMGGGELFPEKLSRNSTKTRISGLSEKRLRRFESGYLKFFSAREFKIGNPPKWFQNPYNGTALTRNSVHWSDLDDFSLEVGDIKTIWETSRFNWALQFAYEYQKTGESRFIQLFNEWTDDWIKKNPVNFGPNWKCGQETAIRLLNMLLVSHIIGYRGNAPDCFVHFVLDHSRRIASTVRYAIAQNNNHGISEAAGLFVAGCWLLHLDLEDRGINRQARDWKKRGERLLRSLIDRLIGEDGSFSQYSVVYHRMMLDILSIVRFWSEYFSSPCFSDANYNKIYRAINWLYQMVDVTSGRAPNIGSNDGSLLLNFCDQDYRDFRPSLQLASALFKKEIVYGGRGLPEFFAVLGINGNRLNASRLFKKSSVFDDGGYITLNAETSWAVVRFPNFQFRPSHADALHFDLWSRGKNILRDAGTFGYNCETSVLDYFSGTRSHNTIEFDNRSQMPRISRFLFGKWLSGKTEYPLTRDGDDIRWVGSYTDYQGCYHKRCVQFNGHQWIIRDKANGFKKKAILRWRLIPDEWCLNGNTCFGHFGSLEIKSDQSSMNVVLEDGLESNYYLEKERLSVLTVYFYDSPVSVCTTITLK